MSYSVIYRNAQLHRPQRGGAADAPHGPPPRPGDMIREVSVGGSMAGPGAAMGEVKRTISLPEESSKHHVKGRLCNNVYVSACL